jgi:hypothetical protein
MMTELAGWSAEQLSNKEYAMSTTRRTISVVASTLLLFSWHVVSQTRSKAALHTQIVLLGTGTPLPDPERAGPSTGIVVNSTPYIVDAGTGLVRRAAAAHDKGVVALRAVNLKIAFLTHLHSDHTWPTRLDDHALDYGPKGTAGALRSCGHAGNG